MAQSYQVKRCPKCGKPRLANEPICGHCRHQFAPPVVNPSPAPTSKSPWSDPPPLTPKVVRETIFGLVAFFALCGFGGYYVVTMPQRAEEARNAPPPSTPRDIRFGMTRDEVRSMLGSPDHTQEMHSAYGGSMEEWYYDDWQIGFERGRVTSVNRY